MDRLIWTFFSLQHRSVHGERMARKLFLHLGNAFRAEDAETAGCEDDFRARPARRPYFEYLNNRQSKDELYQKNKDYFIISLNRWE